MPSVLHPSGQTVDEVVAPVCITVMCPQLTTRFMAREPMEGADDNGMGDGHDRQLHPPTGGQTLVQGGQVRPLGPGGGMADLGQARAHLALGRLGHCPGGRPSRDAHDVRRHRARFDIGSLQHPLELVDCAAAFLHQQ